jgi:hypothetical protein
MRRSVLVGAVALAVVLSGCALVPPSTGSDTASATGTDSAADANASGETEPNAAAGDARPDPDSDTLGWEDGYWYDDPVAVDNSDGLNESERAAVVARAKARVEQIRRLEFEGNVSITVVSASNYSIGGGAVGESLQTFDNVKFEAMFLVGERSDSIAVQRQSRNQTTGGFYNSRRDAIVIRAESDQPTLSGETTLGHELVHALQDQYFNVTVGGAQTRDGVNAALGLIEGDARTVQLEYQQRCESNWSCLSAPESDDEGEGGAASAGPDNFGPYLLEFFPYADGVGLVTTLRDGDDWTAVNDAFESLPDSAVEVIDPAAYGEFEPRDVSLADRTSGGWERVRPANRSDYGTVGRSGLGAMFGRTLYDDYNESSVVDPQTFVNVEGVSVNRSDPLNYDLDATQGWVGDRIHVYQRGGETAYVWRLAWESPAAAERFADAYRGLLGHWDGEPAGGDVWVVDEGPFADAYRITVDGDAVTITSAPTRGDLSEVRAPG